MQYALSMQYAGSRQVLLFINSAFDKILHLIKNWFISKLYFHFNKQLTLIQWFTTLTVNWSLSPTAHPQLIPLVHHRTPSPLSQLWLWLRNNLLHVHLILSVWCKAFAWAETTCGSPHRHFPTSQCCLRTGCFGSYYDFKTHLSSNHHRSRGYMTHPGPYSEVMRREEESTWDLPFKGWG